MQFVLSINDSQFEIELGKITKLNLFQTSYEYNVSSIQGGPKVQVHSVQDVTVKKIL